MFSAEKHKTNVPPPGSVTKKKTKVLPPKIYIKSTPASFFDGKICKKKSPPKVVCPLKKTLSFSTPKR